MPSRHGPPLSPPARALWPWLLAGLLGCKTELAPAWDTAGAPQRAAQAEERFRRFGEGRFEVVSFTAKGESTKLLVDDFHARTLLYQVPFSARVRFTRAFTIDEIEQIQPHIGEPGWTPEAHRDATMLVLALGGGPRRAGAEQEVAAAAVFEDLEPGVRFRAFDEIR